MPIATIVDIATSRQIPEKERRKMINHIDNLLQKFNERWQGEILAKAARTAGDSIEIVSEKWVPILHLLHTLLVNNINFRVGIGVGDVTILRERADECDGPAFWRAREALEEAKKENIESSYRIDEKAKGEEIHNAEKLYLTHLLLLTMSNKQRRYCYQMIWEEKNVTDIAKKERKTKSNVSVAIRRSKCKSLRRVIKKNR